MAVTSDDGALLDRLQRAAFDYFVDHMHPVTGLVADSSHPDSDASIAATGMGLTALAVGAERGWLDRADAVSRARRALRFLLSLPIDGGRDAAGFQGFYYHFLDRESGRRALRSELSTMDSTLLFIGALTARCAFSGSSMAERAVGDAADTLFRRANWQWAMAGGDTVRHGWTPERGFLKARWEGYNEGLLLMLLGLGSPTSPLPPEAYEAWTRTYRWRRIYGMEVLYAGPLFIHQIPHAWIDLRGLQDEPMRQHGLDYFENSRRATRVHRIYARRNPRGYAGYGENVWGVSAGDGPGPAVRDIAGKRRRFWSYRARGVPFGPDDGTLAPWTTVASLPFAPEIVLPALRHIAEVLENAGADPVNGMLSAINPTYGEKTIWRSSRRIGIDLGPVVFQIENHRSGMLWRWMRGCPYLAEGLRRAGIGRSTVGTDDPA